ncbi:protein of unknown function [Paraburkholderia dioscoreae]|uniref:Uncharacterized protein n=1 Tax=Paraburkholderia dioscoreae TaxID=2604047 RepID=A0A5Q4YUJ4_9BURK|nr:protein of unknown function [Paraburkholderia dioscoreae]
MASTCSCRACIVTANCKLCRSEPTQNRRVLRTGGFFMADGIFAASRVFVLTVPMDDWTDARASDHQYGPLSCMDRWAGKEYHDVDQA